MELPGEEFHSQVPQDGFLFWLIKKKDTLHLVPLVDEMVPKYALLFQDIAISFMPFQAWRKMLSFCGRQSSLAI